MIDGLFYLSNYIPLEDQESLMSTIDVQLWRDDLKRRVQHYGYRYDYRARKVTPEMYLGSIPLWIKPLAVRLKKEGHFPEIPDQVIVNEYLPGQGIAHHVDCEPCFGDVIASLSLGSTCVMTFKHGQSDETKELMLETGSLLVMSGEARYEWLHGIPARKSDIIEHKRLRRERRVSVTFRCTLVSNATSS
jgi:alkylated DNA repair dioxygenase AlkB